MGMGMFKKRLKKTFASATLLVGAGLCAVTPANAIVVGGAWDPWYGSPFLGSDSSSTNDDMWWSGSALFYIPDACMATVSGSNLQLTSATCSGMSVSDATVNLTVGEGGTTVSTLNFSGTAALTTVQFTAGGGAVSWVESAWWNPLASGTGTTFDLGNYYFSLGFSELGANLFHTEKTAFLDRHGSHGPDERTFFWNGNGTGHLGDLCGPTTAPFDGDRCGFSDARGTVIFAPIPEPSTYALMFAGLAAVGLMARRRRAQQA